MASRCAAEIGPAVLDPVEQPCDLIVETAFWGHLIVKRRTRLMRKCRYFTHTNVPDDTSRASSEEVNTL